MKWVIMMQCVLYFCYWCVLGCLKSSRYQSCIAIWGHLLIDGGNSPLPSWMIRFDSKKRRGSINSYGGNGCHNIFKGVKHRSQIFIPKKRELIKLCEGHNPHVVD